MIFQVLLICGLFHNHDVPVTFCAFLSLLTIMSCFFYPSRTFFDIFGNAFFFLSFSCMLCCFSLEQHGNWTWCILQCADQYDPEVCLGHLKRYAFKELRAATNNFNSKNILGEGGYGIVYKGYLRDGSVVAVKRLKDYNAVGGEVQFQTEVEVISLAVHRNLLRLIGFCTTESERLLVYPYMPNGSVASQLRGLSLLLLVTSMCIFCFQLIQLLRSTQFQLVFLNTLLREGKMTINVDQNFVCVKY